MIHSARPTVSPGSEHCFLLLCFSRFEMWGRTDNMCENNDPYRPWFWVGRVDQFANPPTLIKYKKFKNKEMPEKNLIAGMRMFEKNSKIQKCHKKYVKPYCKMRLSNFRTWSDFQNLPNLPNCLGFFVFFEKKNYMWVFGNVQWKIICEFYLMYHIESCNSC